MKKFLQIVCLLFSLSTRAQQDPIDSLKKALSNANTDSTKYLLYLSLYYQYTSEGNIDSAIYATEQMQIFAEKNNKKPDEAIALGFHGYQFYIENKFSDAYKLLQLASKMANDPVNEQSSWFAIWHHHPYDGRTSRLYVLSAVDLMFGHLVSKVDVSMQASYYRQAIKLSTEIGDKGMRYIAYMNLGGVYERLDKLDSALIFEQTAEQLASETDDEKYKAIILDQIGEIYFAKGKPDEARKQLHNAITVAKKLNGLPDIVYSYFDLTKIFLQQANADSAYYYAVKTTQEIAGLHERFGGELLNAGTAYQNLASSYKLRNRLDSAYKYEHLASTIIDSLYRSRNKSIQEFQGLSFKDQIRLQELETEKIQTQNKIRTYALLAGIAMILLITFIVYRNNRKTQQAYGLLQKQKAETDLQKVKVDNALFELKSTQAQLVQNEKMASLGELTAGIAHEIQNPLNFVNNFSEVNKELIDELRTELTTGNQQHAMEIAQDIKDNEEKINHHGKRADAIVKGMLQHSRKNSGIKEPTDLNALCDEYVRLAYHGMRAKDPRDSASNSFNVTLNTHYDESIGIVQIIPQDIGRLILNLITNAFYAVTEKKASFAKASAAEEYEPSVSINTEKKNDGVEITVTDNGNGVPPKVLDKIFQPFFTTKPTGQGTGLGLSLAYDIVKVHGGELKVENKEGEYAKFIIQLPTN